MDAIGIAPGCWSREGETVEVMTGTQLVSIACDGDTGTTTLNTARSRFDRVRGRSQPRSSEFARDDRADVATVPPMRSGPALGGRPPSSHRLGSGHSPRKSPLTSASCQSPVGTYTPACPPVTPTLHLS